MKKIHIQEKISGMLLSGDGAMLITLYTGPVVHLLLSPHPHHPHHEKYVKFASIFPVKDWVKGSLLIIASCLA